MSRSPSKFYRLRRSYWRSYPIKDLLMQGGQILVVYLYLRSGPRGNMAGIFEIPLRSIARDLHLSVDEVKRAIQGLESMGVIKYDTEMEYVWVMGAIQEELGEAPSFQQVKGVLTLLESLDFDECAPFSQEARENFLRVPVYRSKLWPDEAQGSSTESINTP